MNIAKTLTLFLLLTFGYSFGFCQTNPSDQDPKAQKILDRLSAELKKYKTVTVDFKTTIWGDNINETQIGKAFIKGKKYLYETDEQSRHCDGKTVWTFLKSDGEVYIDNVEDIEEGISPSEIFSIWEKGFKSKYDKTVTENDKQLDIIRLYPMNPGDRQYHTVIMRVDSKKNRINKITVKGKSGINVTLDMLDLAINETISDSKFAFDPAAHTGVEVVDNR